MGMEELWKLPMGIRNKFLSEQYFAGQDDKKNNRSAYTHTIDQINKIPKFFNKGSFEGMALRARPIENPVKPGFT